MGDPERGLYDKFLVSRVDGRSEEGRKHHGCDYFVLDLTHDPHAADALEAYAHSCRKDYPLLAKDLLDQVVTMDQRFDGRRGSLNLQLLECGCEVCDGCTRPGIAWSDAPVMCKECSRGLHAAREL